MAFTGGSINTIGITPSFVTGLATTVTSSTIPQAVGQIWQGSGQSFYGQAGQALVGNLSSSAINIALNSGLGTQVVGPQGLMLNSGANLLASTITPYVTSSVAAGINQSIQQSLQSAGPFGNLLSEVGTGLVNQVFQGITGNIAGAAGFSQSYKSFAGAGNEPPADYSGGGSYTLGPNGRDVVFSIQPANQGPQAFGLNQSINFPTSITTLPFNELSNMPLLAGSATVNTLKKSSMSGDISRVRFIPKAFTTRSLI
jgi:hypothetical protein